MGDLFRSYNELIAAGAISGGCVCYETSILANVAHGYSAGFLLGLSRLPSPRLGLTLLPNLEALPIPATIAGARLGGSLSSGMLMSRSRTGLSADELLELDFLGAVWGAEATSL